MKFSYAIVTIGHARIAFSYKKKQIYLNQTSFTLAQ